MSRVLWIPFALACGTDPVATDAPTTAADADTDADTDADADTDTDADTDGTDTATAGPPDFQDDIVPMFYRSCGAGDNNCHSRLAYHPQPPECLGWLSLEDAALGSLSPTTGEATGCPDQDLYTRLMEKPAWACAVDGFTMIYVAEGDPTESYLYQKVLPTGVHCYGTETMPPDVAIAPADQRMLEDWILAGAPR